MTALAVDARSELPERARFIRALLLSVLVHGLVLAVKMGPGQGSASSSAPAGGRIEAVLRRAPPAETSSEKAADARIQAAQVAAVAEAAIRKMQSESPSPPATPNPATVQTPPRASTPASGLREEGRDTAPGVPSGADSQAMPVLPPLPATLREVPGRPSLASPLSFSYPAGVRLQSGKVRVRILLDERGQIEEMQVVAAAPPGFFDFAAMQVLRSGRYTAGYVGPIAVRTYLFMEVSFGAGPQGQIIRYAASSMAPRAAPRGASSQSIQ